MEPTTTTTYQDVDNEVGEALRQNPIMEGRGHTQWGPFWWTRRSQAGHAASMLGVPAPRIIVLTKLICIANMLGRSQGIDYDD